MRYEKPKVVEMGLRPKKGRGFRTPGCLPGSAASSPYEVCLTGGVADGYGKACADGNSAGLAGNMDCFSGTTTSRYCNVGSNKASSSDPNGCRVGPHF